MDYQCHAIAKVFEEARKRLLETHGNYYRHLEKTGQAVSREYWLKDTEDKPISDAVNYAATLHNLDEPELMKHVHAGLKWRVLAGTLTFPLYYDDATDHPGNCGRIAVRDGAFDCVLPNSSEQSKADTFHDQHGYGPGCPFWKNPTPQNIRDADDATELEKAFNQGEDLQDAKDHLKNYRSRGV